MNDSNVQDRIEELVREEHSLLEGHRGRGLSEDEHARLTEIRIELDRYWDLLRQRRAHEEFGLDPDETSIRNAETVEGYEG
ncbi:MAG: DUF2630 family protein [Actinomycetota bacterium]|nr:DUF2630 family protein [Actinomycetota bacterium]